MHHGEGLRRLLTASGTSDEAGETLIHALTTDYGSAVVNDADRAMLDYTAKLTLTPGEVEAADVDAVKTQGFDDRAIHDMCAIAAYYAFVNRIADGLGVELEDGRG